MASKEVTDRSKAARSVVQGGHTHGAAAAEALAKELGSHLEKGERAPDVRMLFTLLGRRLEASGASLVAADAAHEKELGDDAEPRTRRDEAAATLYKSATELRGLIEGAYGATALAPLGIRGETPDDPATLETWAGNLVTALRDPAVALPTPKRKGMKLDRAAEAEALEAGLTPLRRALRDVTRERREAEATQAAKNRAMERHDETFAQTAGLFSVLFRAAGMPEVADRVKPSRNRPGRTAAGDADTGIDTGSEGAPPGAKSSGGSSEG